MSAAWTSERFADIDWTAFNALPCPDGCVNLAPTVSSWLDVEQDADRKEAIAVVGFLLRLWLTHNASDGVALQPEGALHSVPREALVALVVQLECIEKLELRTRIADAAWLHGRACSHVVASQCVREYFTLAKQTYDPIEWVQSHAYLRRAVDLAASLGRRQQLFIDHSNAALEMLRAAAPQEALYFSRGVIDLLLQHGVGDPAELAAIAAQIAANAEAQDPFRARDYLHRAVDCWKRAKQPQQADAALREIAASLERQAAQIGASPEGAMHAALLLEEAVTVHRSYADGRAEVERVKPELQRQRATAVAAMPLTELGSVDLSTFVERARDSVQGKPAWDALVAFVSLSHPIALDRLRKSAARMAEIAPISAMFDFSRLARSGQVVDRRPGALDQHDEPALLGRMHEHVSRYHELVVMGSIVPALSQLQLEHGFGMQDFMYLGTRSPFVPRGREPAFAAGLAAGMRNDFFTAAHVLIPQLENALRVHLNAIGVPTLNLPTSGIQNERDLGALLDMPDLARLYDEATIFDWKSLLTEKSGSNLRNELAHGLIEPGSRDAQCAYLWWNILRCVLAPLLNAARSAGPLDGAQTESTGDQS